MFFMPHPPYRHLLFFFFSSRRRHTRSLRDWSSDVCSSDLISMLVGAALEQARGNRSNLVSSLTEVSRLLRETIDTCRNTAQEHGGFLVRKEGLVGAVSRLVERLEHTGGPRFAVTRPATSIVCLDELTAYHLFRIVGEAIVNAHRHSGAKTIDVRATHAGGKVAFEVEDDGAC